MGTDCVGIYGLKTQPTRPQSAVGLGRLLGVRQLQEPIMTCTMLMWNFRNARLKEKGLSMLVVEDKYERDKKRRVENSCGGDD